MIELFFKNKTAVNMAAPSTGQFFSALSTADSTLNFHLFLIYMYTR